MILHLYDVIGIVAYLTVCVLVGLWAGGRPSDAKTYFISRGKVPWWAVSFSIVATETSMLTVISIPVVAYLGSLVFLQIVFGYVVGRIFVAWLILPVYFKGEQLTAYTFFEERFGLNFRKAASFVFLITRLLADGVRLFAAAIPLKVITGLDYPSSIVIIAVVTLAYTYFGGLKSVIWIDVIQMFVYLFGGIYIIAQIYYSAPDPIFSELQIAGKLSVILWPSSISDIFFTPYNLVGAFLGGMFLTMASHGTDQLIVQRLLACGRLFEARKALIISGIFILIQFTIFLFVGLMLFAFYSGASISELGLANPDELVLMFISSNIPPGIAGLIIAGLFAAAMSTLSSSLSALSSSTLFDIFPRLAEREDSIKISRFMMLGWTLIFILFAISFTDTNNPIVEIGLSIAGFTYGGLLGAFLTGRFTKFNQISAFIGLITCVIGMITIITFTDLAWPWFTITGIIIFISCASASEIIQKLAQRR